jgi:Fe-S-cluster-containing dehydrogenase component
MKTNPTDEEKHLSDWDPSINRRDFLTFSLASLAAAGFSGCIRPPVEKIFTYVSQPEEETLPGEFRYFATGQVIGGLASGLLARSHQGRPTKIEGNPSHPSNLGSASAFQQAQVLSLYDADRAQTIRKKATASNWNQFKTEVRALQVSLQKNNGKGLVFLTENSTSPSLILEMRKLRKKFPAVTWIQYDPLIAGAVAPLAFDFAKAKNIISFDSDLFSDPLYPVSAARAVMNNSDRQVLVAECSPTLLGARADIRLALKPSELNRVIHDVHERLLPNIEKKTLLDSIPLSDVAQSFVNQVVAAVKSGSSIFLIDRAAPLALQEFVQQLNLKFASLHSATLRSEMHSAFTSTAKDDQSAPHPLAALADRLHAGEVDAIFVIGGNPAYGSPASLQFAQALAQAKWSARIGLYDDETAQACQWMIPQAHELESWGDSLAADGSLTLIQPLIAPLYEGKSIYEILDLFADASAERSPLEMIQADWQKEWPIDFQQKWRESLRQGVAVFSAGGSKSNHFSEKTFPPTSSAFRNRSSANVSIDENFEIHFMADPHTYDGRFANNSWLQEFPAPLTRITWENVALMHAEDAKNLKVKSGDVIQIKNSSGQVNAPVWIMPGQAKNCISLTFGYGRTHAGKIANDRGYNAYQIWAGDRFTRAQVEKTSQTVAIASTQEHHSMEGRDLIRVQKRSDASPKPKPYYASLYNAEPLPPEENAWSLVIDLDACTGCGACVIACQSENNIPVVGKEMVLMGREMHWIRVDRYFASAGENPVVHFQPVTCMHCEKAPCETVCPTGATLHGNGGLNQMVYNRCVGTRYCSNNCPYKVRRFNFFNYSKTTAVGKLQKNPNVSIRSRGMMEKCSYCVQRINAGRVQAEIENRKINDLEIKTACQSTCPTQAIHFGDLNNEKSVVRRLRESSRNYALLEELGTKPRTTYLAKWDRGSS